MSLMAWGSSELLTQASIQSLMMERVSLLRYSCTWSFTGHVMLARTKCIASTNLRKEQDTANLLMC